MTMAAVLKVFEVFLQVTHTYFQSVANVNDATG
jgi:hypothetical protein